MNDKMRAELVKVGRENMELGLKQIENALSTKRWADVWDVLPEKIKGLMIAYAERER